MLVTLDGIVILVNLPHSKNASASILVTLDGIVISVKQLPQNARYPILFILDGIVISVRLIQLLNALLFILVTLDGILIFSSPSVAQKA